MNTPWRHVYLSILFLSLAGACEGAMDIRRDAPDANVFARITSPAFASWYQGGNETYSWPVRNFIPYDFWHSMKHARNAFLAIAALMLCAFFYTIHNRRISSGSVVASVFVGWIAVYTGSFTIFYWLIWRL